MIVKRYFAPTAREALRALKTELGSGAVVLSNRAVDGGVEIVALPGDAIHSLQNSAEPSRSVAAPAPSTVPGEASHSAAGGAETAGAQDSSASARPAAMLKAAPNVSAPKQERAASPSKSLAAPEAPPSNVRRLADLGAALSATQPRVEPADVEALRATNARLAAELSDIRNMLAQRRPASSLESQRGDDAQTSLTIELLQAGFSPKSVRQLVKVVDEHTPIDEARAKVRSLLQRLLRNCLSEEDIIDHGGVYALIGPTGVGKTTTTAKLAALYVVRYGAANLALITSDTYRIGAQEQLRIYGRIIGVPVISVRNSVELRSALASLQNRHMVLIDNTGMSQRDQRVSEQAAMLSHAGNVKSLLLLNATSQGQTLEDVVRSYSGQHLAGCILTKIDEAPSLAGTLDVVLRHKLKIHYLANGQRVPEDLLLPDLETLTSPILKTSDRDSAWAFRERDAGLMLAKQAGK